MCKIGTFYFPQTKSHGATPAVKETTVISSQTVRTELKEPSTLPCVPQNLPQSRPSTYSFGRPRKPQYKMPAIAVRFLPGGAFLSDEDDDKSVPASIDVGAAQRNRLNEGRSQPPPSLRGSPKQSVVMDDGGIGPSQVKHPGHKPKESPGTPMGTKSIVWCL
jgi:hypothetical protein